MKYTQPLGEQNPNAGYNNGVPDAGIEGSIVPAEAIENPQREIVNAILASGLVPDGADNTQLAKAILMMALGSLSATAPLKCAKDSQGQAIMSITTDTAKNGDILVFDGTKWVVSTPVNNSPYELGEFYYFRHPTLKVGFQPAQGGLLASAATLYPEAWAYLQTVEGAKLCKTEAEWQALTTATWATLEDGTKVGWDGIGGAPYYVVDTGAGTLRLPDLRGMYAEAAGFDSLGVGGVHGDMIRNIQGRNLGGISALATGVFTKTTGGSGFYDQLSGGSHIFYSAEFIASRVVPVGNANKPRSWGALACVYLGTPK